MFEIRDGRTHVQHQLSVILEVEVSSQLGLGAHPRRIADVVYMGPPL